MQQAAFPCPRAWSEQIVSAINYDTKGKHINATRAFAQRERLAQHGRVARAGRRSYSNNITLCVFLFYSYGNVT